MDMQIFDELKRMNKRQVTIKFTNKKMTILLTIKFFQQKTVNKPEKLYYQVLNFAMIVSTALMIWKGLMVVTGSESPIVVVLSGSMEPAFHRGDLLMLTHDREEPIRVGDIVVFKIEGREIPIVHRVLKVHEK